MAQNDHLQAQNGWFRALDVCMLLAHTAVLPLLAACLLVPHHKVTQEQSQEQARAQGQCHGSWGWTATAGVPLLQPFGHPTARSVHNFQTLLLLLMMMKGSVPPPHVSLIQVQ